MATIKFSAFTNEAVDATNTELVGYKTTDLSQNFRYTIGQLATAISPLLSIDTLYSADSTIGTTRIAKVTDTLTFQNLAGTSTLFTLNDNGIFTLGEGATCTFDSGVSIGGAAVSNGVDAICIGGDAQASAHNCVTIGGYSSATAQAVSSIGYGVDVTAINSIGLGHSITASGTESITINAASGAVTTSTQYVCGVYMTSNTTPDFEVVGGGESTLNTNLKVTGQSYSELVDAVNATLTVDWDDGNIQELTSLTGAHVFTASNPKIGATYILTLGQTGAVTPTWTGVKWPAATAPTLSGAGKTDIITLICYDATGAGLYYGTSTLNFTT